MRSKGKYSTRLLGKWRDVTREDGTWTSEHDRWLLLDAEAGNTHEENIEREKKTVLQANRVNMNIDRAIVFYWFQIQWCWLDNKMTIFWLISVNSIYLFSLLLQENCKWWGKMEASFRFGTPKYTKFTENLPCGFLKIFFCRPV